MVDRELLATLTRWPGSCSNYMHRPQGPDIETGNWSGRASTMREAKSSAQVKAFHMATLTAGARGNGRPGYRNYWPGYHAAFVHDPDGHNIEAVWYDYSKVK